MARKFGTVYSQLRTDCLRVSGEVGGRSLGGGSMVGTHPGVPEEKRRVVRGTAEGPVASAKAVQAALLLPASPRIICPESQAI